MYGQTLLYQKEIQDQLKKNYGKMTMHEKKLNKIDLAVTIYFNDYIVLQKHRRTGLCSGSGYPPLRYYSFSPIGT